MKSKKYESFSRNNLDQRGGAFLPQKCSGKRRITFCENHQSYRCLQGCQNSAFRLESVYCHGPFTKGCVCRFACFKRVLGCFVHFGKGSGSLCLSGAASCLINCKTHVFPAQALGKKRVGITLSSLIPTLIKLPGIETGYLGVTQQPMEYIHG